MLSEECLEDCIGHLHLAKLSCTVKSLEDIIIISLKTLTDFSVNRLEPPLTTKLTDNEVKAFIDSPFISTLPCSTNDVKRTHSATSIQRVVSSRPFDQLPGSFLNVTVMLLVWPFAIFADLLRSSPLSKQFSLYQIHFCSPLSSNKVNQTEILLQLNYYNSYNWNAQIFTLFFI